MEIEVAKELIRAHNCIYNTKPRYEAMPKKDREDLEFKARAVLDYIGKNAHRLQNDTAN